MGAMDGGVETNVTVDVEPSLTIKTSVSIYFTIFAVAWIVFLYLQKRKPSIYACRNESTETASVAVDSGTMFGWIKSTWTVSDDVLFEFCGLDTLVFLRVLALGRKLALCGIGLSAALFPLYATGTNPDEEAGRRKDIDPLERITMSNLSNGEPRLWASVVAMYLMSFYAMYLFRAEYQYYVKRRHEFLSRDDLQQYTVLINDLPLSLRTPHTLKYYMDYLFPQDVQGVTVAIECADLEKSVAKREKTRNSLEHAMAVSAQTGTRPTYRPKKELQKEYDAIDYFTEKLAKLNKKVMDKNDYLIKKQQELEAECVATGVEAAAFASAATVGVAMGGVVGLPDDLHRHIKNGITRSSAFVSFTSLQTAQTAQQILQTENPMEMEIVAAPQPDDIVWENIGRSKQEKDSWRLISTAISTAVILFWTIPTAAVVAFSTVDNLQVKLNLTQFFQDYPWMIQVFKQISPLGLAIMTALAPMIMTYLSKREGHPSGAQVKGSTFAKLIYFQTFQIFFVSVIAGSLIESLAKVLDQPQLLIKMLGSSIPAQATMFMTYLIVKIGVDLDLELLRVMPQILGLVYKLFAPKVTARERRSPWFGLQPATIPGDFDTGGALPDYFLALLLVVTFCAIAPLLNYFALMYFVVAELVFRRQVLYVYDPSPHSTGVYWPQLHTFLVGALLLAQVTFLGMISLKVAPGPIVAATVLPFLSAVYYLYIEGVFPRSAKNLPLFSCARLDKQRASQEFSNLSSAFIQPALTASGPIKPDYSELATCVEDHPQTTLDNAHGSAQGGDLKGFHI
ncbi:hypothetical protein H310_08708 [Aphanomyces invadans]|uniref:CSC1/OSCA1-like 7TM region domain-containing protein n=1 Tax=Aphanomyces invadans TaxID=157072 RepID=A0A024TZ10_9STRA|nr:hypothetical protein H310_08708 [Aphanomyces invadans]ETV98587.1 hypothetical protein H310_08708 [Aphanomyces invadans]|eukprot:XP_008872784.1 hypothetical protein H310_08708 [Aphanomyces invadans]